MDRILTVTQELQSPGVITTMWRRRIRRWSLLLLIAAFLSLTGCYATSRLLSPSRAVQVFAERSSNSGDESVATGFSKTGKLRIGAYNIAHGRGNGSDNWDGDDQGERERRLREIAAFLRDSDLDVVVLNEVEFDSSWSHRVNQAEFLAREAGFPYRVEQRNFDVAVPFYSWRFGNAVLSRHPISAARLVEYPAYARWEGILAGQKNGVVCTVDLPNGEQARVLAVHLSHRSERVRIASARMIAEERKRERPPLIAVGDFNSTPTEYPHAESDTSGQTALSCLLDEGDFTTLLPSANAVEQMTFSSTSPSRIIDWILVDDRLQLLSQQVPPLTLSDHRPIIGVIEWKSFDE
jgi:endonuclease/exonuclease/phosphatase family metal-dependent hydrolase